MNIEIRPFDVRSDSQKDWERLGRSVSQFQEEFWPGDAFDTNMSKIMMQSQLEEYDMAMYTAVEQDRGDRILAFSRLLFVKKNSPSYEEYKHICTVIGPYVLRNFRNNGLATKLLSFIHDEVEKAGRTSIVGTTLNEAGRLLVQKIGGKEAQRVQENRLILSEVDWNMVNAWAEEGPRRSPGTRIEFYHSIPDNILERYCELYSELQNQAPRDELEVGDLIVTPESWKARMEQFAKGDMKYLAAVTIEEDGDISGLTDVAWFPSRPAVLMQWLTGVRQQYRGRGLGKWLKGAVLLRVKNEFPSV
ncbi:MAG: hypothetical protein ACFFCT_13855, partial [Candidatus Odinarchaeota archaeon]